MRFHVIGDVVPFTRGLVLVPQASFVVAIAHKLTLTTHTVCALTRFALFIPVTKVDADETLRTLVARVFCVFGTPSVIVSDNGPAFISDLMTAASRFYGYRHIHTLPYNPQANGTAEAAVKRIKLLLDRQTDDYKDWHKLCPLLQQMLNNTVHTGTGMTPFEAVFGYAATGLEQLENPAMYPDDDAHEYLAQHRGRMLYLHKRLRDASDQLKKAHTDAIKGRDYARLQKARRGTVLASTPDHDRYVWLLYGSKENAAYIRKHGHGAPWRHRYKVLEVRPHAVRLEIPSDGTVPRVQEWQPMRRVCVAHPDEHGPDGTEPYMMESGFAVRKPPDPDRTEPDGDLDGDDSIYDIERVVRAERVGNRYRIWLKWVGYDEITYRWRHELVKETSEPTVLADIESAVDAARERHRAEHGYLEEEDDVEATAPTAPPNVVQTESLPTDDTSDTRPIAQRLSRRGAAKQTMLLDKSLDVSELQLVHEYMSQVAFDSVRSCRTTLDSVVQGYIGFEFDSTLGFPGEGPRKGKEPMAVTEPLPVGSALVATDEDGDELLQAIATPLASTPPPLLVESSVVCDAGISLTKNDGAALPLARPSTLRRRPARAVDATTRHKMQGSMDVEDAGSDQDEVPAFRVKRVRFELPLATPQPLSVTIPASEPPAALLAEAALAPPAELAACLFDPTAPPPLFEPPEYSRSRSSAVRLDHETSDEPLRRGIRMSARRAATLRLAASLPTAVARLATDDEIATLPSVSAVPCPVLPMGYHRPLDTSLGVNLAEVPRGGAEGLTLLCPLCQQWRRVPEASLVNYYTAYQGFLPWRCYMHSPVHWTRDVLSAAMRDSRPTAIWGCADEIDTAEIAGDRAD